MPSPARFLAAGSLLLLGLAPVSAARRVLSYGPAVTLTGRIQRVVFPGPPGYRDVRKGDAREVTWVLRLSEAIDVRGAPRNEFDVSRKNVRDLQMAVDPETYRKQGNLVGKRVVVTGTLFGEHTAHHHTAVLISVTRLQATK
jgi:hypothetical protein